MELFETLKSVFADSEDKIILADADMNIIWKNSNEFPDEIDISKIRTGFKESLTLPLEKSVTAEYTGGFGDSCAVKIKPLREKENAEIKGYIMTFYTCDDIQRLSDKSGLLKYRANFLGNIRIELSKMNSMLETQKNNSDFSSDLSYLKFDREMRSSVIKTLSVTVNYNELSKYYTGFFESGYLDISQTLGELCGDADELMSENGCIFRFDIEPDIYMNMCADRLRAAAANLLVNAYMYNSREQKQCELTLKSKDDKIILKVTDNGDGMDSETIRRAVVPFGAFRNFGTGESLGLAIVKQFTDYYKGKLEIKSSPDGTEILMTFNRDKGENLKSFRLNRIPPVRDSYDLANCILSKAFDTIK